MKQTAVEYLLDQMFNNGGLKKEQGVMYISPKLVEKAKEMEKKETLKRQLFIGKVSEVIGFEKTLELWQETLNEIK